MARSVVIRVPDVEDEMVLPGDEFFINEETGELTVYRFFKDPNSDAVQMRPWGHFASYSYVYIEDDGENDPDEDFQMYEQLYGASALAPEEDEEDDTDEDFVTEEDGTEADGEDDGGPYVDEDYTDQESGPRTTLLAPITVNLPDEDVALLSNSAHAPSALGG